MLEINAACGKQLPASVEGTGTLPAGEDDSGGVVKEKTGNSYGREYLINATTANSNLKRNGLGA